MPKLTPELIPLYLLASEDRLNSRYSALYLYAPSPMPTDPRAEQDALIGGEGPQRGDSNNSAVPYVWQINLCEPDADEE